MIHNYNRVRAILDGIVDARHEAEEAERRACEARERLKRLAVKDRDSFGGYASYPLADVARAAGISRKTLYEWIKEADRNPE